MVPPAKAYSDLLDPILGGKANFDPCYCQVRLGDFGFLREGEFRPLINLINPEDRPRRLLEENGLGPLPQLSAMPLQWRVETPREQSQQGVTAVGATLQAEGGLRMHQGVPSPITAIVTVKFSKETAAMLSLENYERKVIKLEAVDIACAKRYLRQKDHRRRILRAFEIDTSSECFFVTRVDLCYGYSNTFTHKATNEHRISLSLGLVTEQSGEELDGCIARRVTQSVAEGAADKEWKYVFAYRGVQWNRWPWRQTGD